MASEAITCSSRSRRVFAIAFLTSVTSFRLVDKLMN